MMRSVLAAIAALALLGTGAIAQGVSFGGSAGMGVKYAGATEDDNGNTTMESTISWISDFDISISASGTTDGGLQFGASTAVEAGHGGGSVADSEVHIGGESWSVKIGGLDPASHKGRSLGDVGYDGLGVDDVAEKVGGYGGTKSNVEVSFNLGTASLAITAGQSDGTPRKVDPEMYTVTKGSDSFKQTITLMATDSLNKDEFMAENGTQYVVIDDDDCEMPVVSMKTITGEHRDDSAENMALEAPEDDDAAFDNAAYSAKYTCEKVTPAKKQDTEWAAGVGFDIGSTTLGLGIDSNKLMQASVGADLGAFSGKLFYSQQKDETIDVSGDDKSDESNTVNNKRTGMGVEIAVSAGANTTINAVYAQGKQTDTRTKHATKDELVGGEKKVSQTDKGFGVGVSHSLGGGATLQAGFAKVMDQSKASVGVTMSF